MGAFGGSYGGSVVTARGGVEWAAFPGGVPGSRPAARSVQPARTPRARNPNIVLIGSPAQERPLREVHRQLAGHPGVVACSRLVSLSTYPRQSYRQFNEVEQNGDANALDKAMDRLICDAAKTANVALVVNVEPEPDEHGTSYTGGIRRQEYDGQIAPILANSTPVLFMNPVPRESSFHGLTPAYNECGFSPDNVVGACWQAIVALTVHGAGQNG